jgi:hypothetical protein
MPLLAIRPLVELWSVIALGCAGATAVTSPAWRLVLGLGAWAFLLALNLGASTAVPGAAAPGGAD